MKLFSLMHSAFFLSINRFFMQVGSIAILSILGHYNTDVLASYAILFSTMSIFFVLAVSGQTGLQAAFARLHTKKVDSMVFLGSSFTLFGIFSILLCLVILCIGATNFIKGNGVIFEAARDSFSLFVLCIPILTANNILAMFMEGNGLAKVVSKNRICLVSGEVACIAVLAIFFELSLFKITVIFTVSYLIGLVVLVISCYKNHLVSIHDLKFKGMGKIGTILKIGLPTTLSQLFMTYVAFILVTKSAFYGTTSVVILSTINSLAFLIQIPVVGISQQVGLEVAKQHVEQKPIWQSIRMGLMVVIVIACIAGLLLWFGHALLGAMLTNDGASRAVFSDSIGLITIYLISCAFSVFLGSLFYAAGDYVIPQIIIPLCMALGFLPYAMLKNHHQSFIDIFACYVIVGCVADVFLLARCIFLYRTSIIRLPVTQKN